MADAVVTHRRPKKRSGFSLLSLIIPTFKPAPVFIWSLLSFLFILPYVMLFYPGMVEIDTIFQLAEYLGYGNGYDGDGSWTSLFPIFGAHLMGWLYTLGVTLGGTQETGIFSICLFQVIGSSIGLGTLVCYLEKWRVPVSARVIAWALVLGLPIFPHQVVNIGKDAIFTLFFIGYLVCYLEALRTEANSMTKMPWIISTILFSLLLSMSRPTGLILVVASYVVLMMAVCRSAPMLAFMLLPIVFSFAASYGISTYSKDVLNISDYSQRETFGTPMQQTTRYILDRNECTEEEMEALEAFYNVDGALLMNETHISDPVKAQCKYDPDATKDFILAYISMGLKHPESYAAAFYDLYSGYISLGNFDSIATVRFTPGVSREELGLRFRSGSDMSDDLSYMRSLISDLEHNPVVYSQTLLPEYETEHMGFGDWEESPENKQGRADFFCTLIDMEQIPLLDILISKGLYVTFLPLGFFLVALVSRNRKVLLPIAFPILMVSAFAFVSPVDFTRYILPEIALDFFIAVLMMFNLDPAEYRLTRKRPSLQIEFLGADAIKAGRQPAGGSETDPARKTAAPKRRAKAN